MADHDGKRPNAPDQGVPEGTRPAVRNRDEHPPAEVAEAGHRRVRASRQRRFRLLQLEISLWRHRVLHPVSTLRHAASRLLPYRVRAALLRAARRGWSATSSDVANRQAFFRLAKTTPPPNGPARPTIICLPLVEWSLRVQRPHHLLARLAGRGWPVLYASLELGVGAAEIRVDPEPLADGIRSFTMPSTRTVRAGEKPLRGEDVVVMAEAFSGLRRSERIHEAIVLCHSPFWRPLARLLKAEFGWPVVYDRMDLHEGFSTTARSIVEEEELLLAEADLVTATADVLKRVEGNTCNGVLRLPNACDPEHWRGAMPSEELAQVPRPVIGYFGAISEWFDAALVAEIASARPAWSFVLIGSTWGADTSHLEMLPNVHLLGERPYGELPALAAAFDVGIIPFKRTPLTEATDPVKLYEMLALGLEVVAPPLRELVPLGDLIHLAEGPESFLEAIEDALGARSSGELSERRRAFALANTWDTRTDTLERALRDLFPKVTIGIVTFNNRALTELCLDSIERFTVHPNIEIVVVDNASDDGTREWLENEAANRADLRFILNQSNRGFAAACNQFFAESRGSVLCFLNNDTVVTRGWLSTMVRALNSSPGVGMVGPSTNGVANEARVEPGYDDLDGLPEWAEDFVWRHDGKSFSIPMLALYCTTLPREVWEEVGGLDERFEVGMFEDDDFSRRIRRAGYDIRCLRGAWVHHFQEASFGALPEEEYARIYEANRRRYRNKWRGSDGTDRETSLGAASSVRGESDGDPEEDSQ